MAKKNRGKQKPPQRSIRRSDASDPLQQGLRAFQAGHFDDAIALWTPLISSNQNVAAALAEAHFRCALRQQAPATQQAHLQTAMELAPNNLRFSYYMGLLFHQANQLPQAIEWYRAVLADNASWPQAGLLLALAELEQTSTVDLSALPGSTPAILAALAPVQALLRNEPVELPGDDPRERFWRGLARIAAGDGSASAELADHRALPSAAAIAIRRYYTGVAAAQQGDLQTAIHAWQHLSPERFNPPWLHTNMIAALQRYLTAAQTDGRLAQAADTSLQALAVAAEHAGLAETVLQILDQAAHAAAADANWERAIVCWEGARRLVAARSGLGSPRPLHHNLALAYEAQEQWPAAAEAWRAMLRTRPRASAQEGDPAPGAFSVAHWAWVRRRIITCYQKAGTPAEAVTLYRQALKAEPNDLELRVQLVDALLANDQEQAALNELGRILQIDPAHSEALLRRASIHLVRGEAAAAEQMARRVLARTPDSEPARRLLARVLLTGGLVWHQRGRYEEAQQCLIEGQQLDPHNYEFPLNRARIAIDLGEIDQARPLLEQTLELGAANPGVSMLVLDCWVQADQLDDARAVIERMKTALPVTADFYIDLALMLVRRTLPDPPPMVLFDSTPPPPFTPPPMTPVTRLMLDVLELAVALQPDDPEIYYSISESLVVDRPDLALPYAERAVKLTPEDPEALITLGLAMGLLNQVKEAKKILRRAASQARILGEPALMRRAERLAREVGSPALHRSLSMDRIAEHLGIDFSNLGF